MNRQRKRVLVTGSCRSGTHTMTRYLQDAGLRVLHEQIGEDGTVWGMYFLNFRDFPLMGRTPVRVPRYSDYEFDSIVHLVRNPLRAIPSRAATYSRVDLEWLEKQGLVEASVRPRLLHSARLWLEINRRAESITRFRVRVEDLETDETWERLRKRLRLPGEKPEIVRHMNKSTGYRKAEPTTWERLFELDERLGQQIFSMAVKYDYEESDI